MATTKTSNTNGNPTDPAFRIVMRGTTRGGVYKRAVRTVHAPDAVAAAGFMAENGEKLAKGLPFAPTYVQLFVPIGTGLTKGGN